VAGTLYVVSTPIGNLEDITLRALRLLREVGLIAAEDTRHTRQLLNHFEINTPTVAYHEHNKLTKLDFILEKLEAGENVALVSDAGTPCLSDPGFELVRACLDHNIAVEAAPGASAALVALVLSGFSPQQFTFVAFPPRKKNELRTWFQELKPELARRPLLIYEAPHRLVETLEVAVEILGQQQQVASCRELTKLHQEVRRESLANALAHFSENSPRGEFTLVFAPIPQSSTEPADLEQQALNTRQNASQRLAELKANGQRAKAAIEQVAVETGLNRRELYDLWLSL
jgi:16S rRNA (cytidine1402-2'-O)-methyltransferase